MRPQVAAHGADGAAGPLKVVLQSSRFHSSTEVDFAKRLTLDSFRRSEGSLGDSPPNHTNTDTNMETKYTR